MPHPYLEGAYAPIHREIEATLSVREGAAPRDVTGTFVRNGPNPRFTPEGLRHWFDGDGMLHAVRLEGGELRYRNRYIETPAFGAESQAGRALWRGLMEPYSLNPSGAPTKDTGNTDVLFHDGELIALHYLRGGAHRVDPVTLATRGEHRFGRERAARMTAHAKSDPRTGELLFFDYGPRPPFMRYGEVAADGTLSRRVDIELPGPRLPHDMAFTERYAILMDLPVRPRAGSGDKHRIEFADEPARFGVIERGTGEAVRWFEASPCYVYHSVNAWEEDGAVVMIGCRSAAPLGTPDPADGPHQRAFATLRLDARFHRWRFDLETGATTETALCDRNAEFPTIAMGHAGVRSRFSYHMSIAAARTLLFDGILKYDADAGLVDSHHFGPGVYGSEAPFGPRDGALEEDDGYLFTFVHDSGEERSELWIYDARELSAGPIAKAPIPQRVPLGFHAAWAPATRGAS